MFHSGPLHMSPVTGLARLVGRIEQGAIFQVSSRLPGWSVNMGKFLTRLPRSPGRKSLISL